MSYGLQIKLDDGRDIVSQLSPNFVLHYGWADKYKDAKWEYYEEGLIKLICQIEIQRGLSLKACFVDEPPKTGSYIDISGSSVLVVCGRWDKFMIYLE
ncbi:hypothetical protein [Thorsellia anophelis]|uniref:Uncharacterized protein n=1 Tax=Thorsellia anophelis DSM 18579 TaxID=1123402 RepID=A0A1I0D7Y0_9GAMM|nr:hypothetical protein [Thorsellia anophelis]SET27628.1 hypothetical protein SAMN02583745_01862 [Thorsellia anophelis DSM 18579]